MENLTPTMRRTLKQRAHLLKPIVRVGNKGVTESVKAELDQALTHHELVKIKLNIACRDEKKASIEALCDALGAALVQSIGHVATLYRPTSEDT